ncbi:MAG: ASCH domain-containing protein [Acholeplasma sp.]
MGKIIISINPVHVDKILNGTKKYEYRTKAAKRDIHSLLIYSTYPTKKVVAEVEIIEVLEMTPSDLWESTKEFSGIEKEFYNLYFENREVAFAYKLGKVVTFESPKSLVDFGLNYAPQSFVYLKI